MQSSEHKHKGIKLKGFTLLETLFVVFLTSIVISLTFVYFTTFQKYIQGQNNTLNYELEVLRFESLMQYDIDRSTRLVRKGNSLVLEGIDMQYTFFESYLVRHQYENSDTLQGNNVKWHTQSEIFKGIEIISSVEVSVIDFKNRSRNYIFRKDYDIKTKLESYNKKKE